MGGGGGGSEPRTGIIYIYKYIGNCQKFKAKLHFPRFRKLHVSKFLKFAPGILNEGDYDLKSCGSGRQPAHISTQSSIPLIPLIFTYAL